MPKAAKEKRSGVTLPFDAFSLAAIVGFGLWWAWTDSFWLMNPLDSATSASPHPSVRCLLSVGMCIGLVIPQLPLKKRPLLNNKALAVTAFCMGAFPLFMSFAPILHESTGTLLLSLGALLSGLTASPLFLAWLSEIARNGQSDPRVIMPLALLVNVAIVFPLIASGGLKSAEIVMPLRFAIPCASTALIIFARKKMAETKCTNNPSMREIATTQASSSIQEAPSSPHNASAENPIEAQGKSTGTQVPIVFLVGLFFFSFAFAFLLDCSSTVSQKFEHSALINALGPFVASLFFLFTERVLQRKSKIGWGLKFIVTPTLAAGYLTLPVIGLSFPALSCTIAWVGVDYFMLAIFTLLCEIIRKLNIRAEPLFSQSLSSHLAGLALGTSLGSAVTSLFEPSAMLFSIAGMLMLVPLICIAFWMMDDHKVETLWGLDKKPAPLVQAERIKRQCALAETTFGLTAREAEITSLLAHNRSVNDIAEELSISVKTVRTHVHNIYYKVDAHSRTELTQILKDLETTLSHGSAHLTVSPKSAPGPKPGA